MAIYEVTIRQTYYSQEVLNRLHYVDNDLVPTPSAPRLAQAIGATGLALGLFPLDTLMRAIQNLAIFSLEYLEVEVRNLYSDTDFFTVAYNPAPAGQTSDTDPVSPAIAYGFVSNRTTLAVRRGHKRFCGVGESGMDAGGVVSGEVTPLLVAVADALSANATITDGLATWTFVPAVLHEELYHPEPGKNAYRPFATEEEQLANAAVGVSWQFMDTVRTQRSRQYGRGR